VIAEHVGTHQPFVRLRSTAAEKVAGRASTRAAHAHRQGVEVVNIGVGFRLFLGLRRFLG
jgi:hypothetical protein